MEGWWSRLGVSDSVALGGGESVGLRLIVTLAFLHSHRVENPLAFSKVGQGISYHFLQFSARRFYSYGYLTDNKKLRK